MFMHIYTPSMIPSVEIPTVFRRFHYFPLPETVSDLSFSTKSIPVSIIVYLRPMFSYKNHVVSLPASTKPTCLYNYTYIPLSLRPLFSSGNIVHSTSLFQLYHMFHVSMWSSSSFDNLCFISLMKRHCRQTEFSIVNRLHCFDFTICFMFPCGTIKQLWWFMFHKLAETTLSLNPVLYCLSMC